MTDTILQNIDQKINPQRIYLRYFLAPVKRELKNVLRSGGEYLSDRASLRLAAALINQINMTAGELLERKRNEIIRHNYPFASDPSLYSIDQKKQMHDLSMDQLEEVSGGFNFGTLIGSVIIWWGCAGASICIEAFTEDDCIDSLT